jgi:hypothetical protein
MPVELLEVIKKELVPQDIANAKSEDCAMDGICDASTRTDCNQWALVISCSWGTAIGLITEAPEVPPLRSQGQRGKIQDHGQRGAFNDAKNKRMGQMQQRARVEMVVTSRMDDHGQDQSQGNGDVS